MYCCNFSFNIQAILGVSLSGVLMLQWKQCPVKVSDIMIKHMVWSFCKDLITKFIAIFQLKDFSYLGDGATEVGP